MDSHCTRRTLLKTATGAAATVTGLAAFSGSATAHFPPELSIDIRPDSPQNVVNPRSDGVVTVAVLQTDTFDPTREDVRYRFGAPDVLSGGAGAMHRSSHVRDVDGDGRDDLVLQFDLGDAGFDGDESQGELRWDRDETRQHGYSGTDVVRVVGRR
jgi:hypothetical protein